MSCSQSRRFPSPPPPVSGLAYCFSHSSDSQTEKEGLISKSAPYEGTRLAGSVASRWGHALHGSRNADLQNPTTEFVHVHVVDSILRVTR